MSSMRDNMKIILFITLVGFVGLIFFQWGMQQSQGPGRQSGIVAKVNGHEIPWETYRLLRQQTMDNFEARTGRKPELGDFDAIEDEVWIKLIREAVVNEQIKKYDIAISDAEILQTLRMNPPAAIRANFKTESGEFDVAAYSQALADPAMAQQWAAVEDYLRATMPPDKIENYVAMEGRVTSNEVHERFVAQNEKVTVRYVAALPGRMDFDADSLDDATLRAHYDAHAEDYRVGARAVLDFVRVSKAPTAQDSTDAHDDLASLRDQIREGADFADIAKTWSEDGSADRGGDLGFIAQGDMVPEFERVAWATPVGEVSDVFSTPFGYHILKVEERKEENGQEKRHVRHILLRVEASSETLRDASDKMDDFLEAVADGESFQKAATEIGLTLETTEPFESGAPIPGIGMLGQAERFAFSNPVGTVTTEAMEDRTALYAFRVVKKLPGGLLPFEEVKDRVRADVETQRRRELARDAIQSATEAGDGSLESLAKALDTTVQAPAAFSRESFVPGVGRRNAFVATAFTLPDGGRSGVVETDRGFYVIEQVSREPADEAKFAEQRDQLRQQLLSEKRQTLVTAWLESLIVSADIVDYRNGKGVPWKADPSVLYYGGELTESGA